MPLRQKQVKDQVIVITGASSGIGLATAREAASRSLIRADASEAAAWEWVARSVQPGRSITANGIILAISRQPRHLWKLARLSAPMIQTKFTPGQRRLRYDKVSTV